MVNTAFALLTILGQATYMNEAMLASAAGQHRHLRSEYSELIDYMESVPLADNFKMLSDIYILPMNLTEAWS